MIARMSRAVSALLLISFSTVAAPLHAEAPKQQSAAEEVRIPSDPGVVLAGTLRTPKSPGPVPAVLFIGGSGPGGRGGLSPLIERLLGNGIAFLEYDKRGVGQSTGEFVDTLQNMETDAAAAVKYLRTRTDIDGSRIALIGHSQGGAVAPAVAAKDPAVAAVVMLAGPAAPGKPGPVNLIIMKGMLAKAGVDQAAIKQVADASDQLFQAEARNAPRSEIAQLQEAVIQGFIAGKFTRSQAEGMLQTMNSIVFEAWQAQFDRTLASLNVPVLVLYASEDEYLSTTSEMPAAKAALARNPDATVLEIEGVNHAFRQVKNANPESHAAPFAAPQLIETVGEWLNARLHPVKPVAPNLN